MLSLPQKIDVSKLKKGLEKMPRILATQAPLLVVLVILVDVLVGAVVFYQYSFLAQKREPTFSAKPLAIQEQDLAIILGKLSQKEKEFKQADSKSYPDLFRSEQVLAPRQPAGSEELTE